MLGLNLLNSSLVAKLKIFMKSVFLEHLEQLEPSNPFHATGLILYPLKALQNLRFFYVFRGYRKRPVARSGFMTVLIFVVDTQRQRSICALRKRCSKNMQQIYWRTPMQKLLYNFIEITLRNGCSPVNLLHITKAPFFKNTYGRLLLDTVIGIWKISCIINDVNISTSQMVKKVSQNMSLLF